jgi:hypothetical protein
MAPIFFYWLINMFLYQKKLVELIKLHEAKMLKIMVEDSYQYDNKRRTKIFKDSLFFDYFIKKIFGIFQIGSLSSINTKNLKFKQKYLEKLIKSSKLIKKELGKYKKKKKEQMNKWKTLQSTFKSVLINILSSILTKIFQNIRVFFYVCVNILIFISVTTNLERRPFQAGVLFWVLLSYIVMSEITLIYFALIVVFPLYVVDGIARDLFKILKYFFSQGEAPQEKADYENLAIFACLMCYVFLLILKSKQKNIKSRFKRFFSNKIEYNENSTMSKLIKKLTTIFEFVLNKLMHNFRFVALIFGIFASLVTVNLLNALLLIATLTFMWKTKYDDKYWIYYVYYSIFFIPLLYSTRIVPIGLSTFNLEIISIIGVYSGSPENCKTFFSTIT